MLDLECCSTNSGGGTFEFPQEFLTQSDIGKLVMNKNGKAVVVNRNTPRPSQQGQWTLTVNSVLEAPVPTEIQLTLIADVKEGDYIRLGVNVFEFRSLALTPNDIQIYIGDVATQIQAITDKLNTRYPNLWFASNNGLDSVNIVINSPFISGLNNVFNRLEFGLFYPPFKAPDQWEVNSYSINTSLVKVGDKGSILNLNQQFLSGLIQLNWWNVMSYSSPNGTLLFGLRFPNTPEELAENIEVALNTQFSAKVSASRVGNVVTIQSVADPENEKENNLRLESGADNYLALQTNQFAISANNNAIQDPVLGTLESISNGIAIIRATAVQKLKLSGTQAVSVAPMGNDLETETTLSRILLAANDGTVETLKSWKDANPGVKMDTWLLYHYVNFGVVWWALSEANVGSEVVATSALPYSAISIALKGLFGD